MGRESCGVGGDQNEVESALCSVCFCVCCGCSDEYECDNEETERVRVQRDKSAGAPRSEQRGTKGESLHLLPTPPLNTTQNLFFLREMAARKPIPLQP